MAFSDIFNPINSISNMIMNIYDRKKKNEENQIMREREDNAVQRHVQDLQNAGLSPLADMGGASASMGSTSEPGTVENLDRETANPETIKQEKNLTLQGEEELRAKKLENDSREIELIYQEEEHQIELEKKKTEIEKMLSESKESSSRGDYFEQEIENKKKELEMINQQINESESRVDLMRSESDLNKSKKKRQDIENDYADLNERVNIDNRMADTDLKKSNRYLTEQEIELKKLQRDLEVFNRKKAETMLPYEIQEYGLKLEQMAQAKNIEFDEFTSAMQENGWYKDKEGNWNWSRTQADQFYRGKNGVIRGTNVKIGTLHG